MATEIENLPDRFYLAEQVRQLDRIAIEDLGIPGYSLMQRAASFSYDILNTHWPDAESIVVVCGGGNNAGDGYVLARLAHEDNKQVEVINLFDPARLSGDAATAYNDLIATGISPKAYSSTSFTNVDVIVDAIFGTGLDRDVEGQCHDVINAINSARVAVLSIDISSGLNANTGKTMGIAVQADVTASFIGLKQGLFTADGVQCSGQIEFDKLDVADEVYQRIGRQSALRLNLEKLNHVLKPRLKNSHKGHFGHVLVVGGDAGYLGAARMAAEAAARVGAGLVSVATRAAHAGLLSTVRPELMSHGVESVDVLKNLIKRANVIAIGPGLGQSEWAKSLFACVLESKLPLVIDADALNLLAEEEQSSSSWVITPHPGEAARLLKTDTKTIQSDRFQAIRSLHEKYTGPVILKGSGTLIIDTEGEQFINTTGNPGMSSGGMGDVLSGVIAGLIAQGIELNHATKLGVCLHAQAADRAASISGERGLLALDLMPHLRNLVNP